MAFRIAVLFWPKSRFILLSLIFNIAAQFGIAVMLQNFSFCRSSRTGQLGSLQIVVLMLISNLCLKFLGWKTTQQLIDTESKIVTFKSLKNLDPKYLCELFNKNSACSSRNLRNTNTDVRLPKKNTAEGQKIFSFRGAKIWNSLSTETKLAPSLYKFKEHLGR